MIPQRINLRNIHAVGADTACSGTSSRSDWNILAACIADVIPYNQEIVHISHLHNHLNFPFHTLNGFLRRRSTIPAHQSFFAKLLEKLCVVNPLLLFEFWQVNMSRFKGNLAAFCKCCRILDGLRNLPKQLHHFLRAFQVKLRLFKPHSGLLRNGLPRLHAK